MFNGLRSGEMQLKAYTSCYPLAAVVDKLAEFSITGKLKVIRAKGKGAQDEATSPYAVALMKLLKNPNPMQSWEQFWGQRIVYKKIFGFCPVLPICAAGFRGDPSAVIAMVLLPPWLFDVVGTGKFLPITGKKSDLVKNYTCTILGSAINLDPEDVFILEDGFMQDEQRQFLLPLSRLVGLDMMISNACIAGEANNVLLRRRGPLGFISHDAAATKDSTAGYIPMTSKEKAELQDALAGYGITWEQLQWVISRQAVKWNNTGFNVKELQLDETGTRAEKGICHRMGYPYALYEETESTYANDNNNARKACYEDSVIPDSCRDLAVLGDWFKASDNNCELYQDFDHISALQADEKLAQQANFFQAQALQIAWLNNIITRNQWLQEIGEDILDGPEGEMYYKDEAKIAAEQSAALTAQYATNENQGAASGN